MTADTFVEKLAKWNEGHAVHRRDCGWRSSKRLLWQLPQILDSNRGTFFYSSAELSDAQHYKL